MRVSRIEFRVAGYEQIESPIVIVVTPARPGRPAAQRDSCFFGYIGESAIVIVVIKPVLAVIGHVNIRPTIVVIVSYCNSEPPALVGNSGFRGDVCKSAIVIVMEQHRFRRRLVTL